MSSSEKPFGVPGGGELAPTGTTDEDEARAARAANRFDIRRIIGGLLTLYGIVLVVVGIVGSHGVKTKAAGVNINLWTRLGMLVAGGLLIAWALLRPTLP